MTDRTVEGPLPPGSAPLTGPRRPLTLLALNWPGVLLVISAVLAGKIQPELVRDLPNRTPRPIHAGLRPGEPPGHSPRPEAGDVRGRKRAQVAVGVCGLGGQVVTALAPTFTVTLVGHTVTGLYTPAGPLCLLVMRHFLSAPGVPDGPAVRPGRDRPFPGRHQRRVRLTFRHARLARRHMCLVALSVLALALLAVVTRIPRETSRSRRWTYLAACWPAAAPCS